MRSSEGPAPFEQVVRQHGPRVLSVCRGLVDAADVVIVIGANPTENHPVAATFLKDAAARGAQSARGEGDAAHARHDHVGEHQVEAFAVVQERERRGGAGSPLGREAEILKQLRGELAHRAVVLDDQHPHDRKAGTPR